MTFKFWIPRRNNRTNPRIWPTAMQYSPFQAATVIIYMNEHFINWPIALYTICAETYHQKEIRTQFLSQFQVVIRTLRNNAWQSQSKKKTFNSELRHKPMEPNSQYFKGKLPSKTPIFKNTSTSSHFDFYFQQFYCLCCCETNADSLPYGSL